MYTRRRYGWVLVFSGECHAMAFSRDDSIVGGDSETTFQIIDGQGLTQPAVLSRTPKYIAICRVMTKKSDR